MISLISILKEAVGQPKAIILAGAPGAGKGFVLKGLNISGLPVLNIDDTYIQNLKKANVSLDLKNASAEDRSKQAKAMADANKEFAGKVAKTIEGKQSFILDGTAASYKKTEALVQELKKVGYEVFMLYVYTDLERSLKQNELRFAASGGKDRSLAPAIVMSTWLSVTKNWAPYKQMFGDNFVSVANTLQDEKLKDVADVIKKYLDPFKPTGTKPKTPAQIEKRKKQKAETNAQIQALLSDDGAKEIIDGSVSKEEAQSKIKQFLSS